MYLSLYAQLHAHTRVIKRLCSVLPECLAPPQQRHPQAPLHSGVQEERPLQAGRCHCSSSSRYCSCFERLLVGTGLKLSGPSWSDPDLGKVCLREHGSEGSVSVMRSRGRMKVEGKERRSES